MTLRSCRFTRALGVCLVFGSVTSTAVAQPGARDGEWRHYGGDEANTRYSPLDQITADNFSELELVWRMKTDNFGPVPEYNFQSTPLMVGGVVYSTVGTRRSVVAAGVGVVGFLGKRQTSELAAPDDEG